MAGFDQRARNGASLSSMLPSLNNELNAVVKDERRANPARKRLMDKLQAEASSKDHEVEVHTSSGIYIGWPEGKMPFQRDGK